MGDNDAKMVWNQYHSENPPNYVTVLSAGCFDPNDMLTTADTFFEAANLEPTRIVSSNFSASGRVGIVRTNEFLARHPGIDARVVVIDPYNYLSNESQYDLLLENEVPLIFVGGSRNQELARDCDKLGLDTYYLYVNGKSNGHLEFQEDGLLNLVPYL